ncbi:MAG: peptidoglycan-associated lipoprotein Pal [Burkholderiaceae bacterium]
MKKLLLTLCLTSLLGACASSVRLDEVPVEDKKPQSVATTSSTGSGSDSRTGQIAVVPIDVGTSARGAPGTSATSNASRLVYFDYDSYLIKPEYQAAIDAQARYLKADKSRKAMIEGHTDERGGREYNLALGQKRSDALRQALALLGVAESQMDAVSFGKEKPANPGNDEEAFSQNRRAEVVYR